MSFPYTLDLSFGSEKSSVDSVGRVSFGKSGGGGGDQSKSISFPLASTHYNFQAPSIDNENQIIWAHLENVTLDENAPQIVKDWWATKPTLKYEPWPVTELPSSMNLYYEYKDSSDSVDMGFLFEVHPNDPVYTFYYWTEGMNVPTPIITGDLVLDDPDTWSIDDIDSNLFPSFLYK